MRKFAITSAILGAGVLASGIAANAQYFNFSTVTTGNVAPTATAFGVTMTGQTGLGYNTGDIVVASVIPVAPAHPGNGLTSITDPWTVALTLQGATTSSGAVTVGPPVTETFSGVISGFEGKGGSALSDALTGGGQTYVYNLGGGYKATVMSSVPGDGFTSPGKPGSQGLLDFQVSVTAPVITNSTPEPGAIATLFGISVPGVLLGARRRRKQSGK
jgi:hypothetical protein